MVFSVHLKKTQHHQGRTFCHMPDIVMMHNIRVLLPHSFGDGRMSVCNQRFKLKGMRLKISHTSYQSFLLHPSTVSHLVAL